MKNIKSLTSLALISSALILPATSHASLENVGGTVINLKSDQPTQAARGNMINFRNGNGQAILIFKQGTEVRLELPDGTVKTPESIRILNLEQDFDKTGKAGAKSSPGIRCYAGFSIEEAIAARASYVGFTKPVIVYIPNVPALHVGDEIEAGFTDAITGRWVSTEPGKVIRMLNINNDMVELDVDGRGNPADSIALDALAISEEERKALVPVFAKGQTFWRIKVSRFTP